MLLAEDEDVIEQLSAERAGQALSKGIHVRRAYRGAHDAHARRCGHASEASTEPQDLAERRPRRLLAWAY